MDAFYNDMIIIWKRLVKGASLDYMADLT